MILPDHIPDKKQQTKKGNGKDGWRVVKGNHIPHTSCTMPVTETDKKGKFYVRLRLYFYS